MTAPVRSRLHELALDYYRDQNRFVEATARVAVQMWDQVDPKRIAESWREQLPELTRIVTASQTAVARQADPYVRETLAAQDLDPTAPSPTSGDFGGEVAVDPQAFTGASDGRGLLSLLANPIVVTLLTIADIRDVTQALRAGRQNLDMLVRTQVADAGRLSTQTSLVSRPAATGYIRMTDGNPCARCLVLAGRFYQWNRGFLRHPRCGCVHVPAGPQLAGRVPSPREIYDAMSPAERRLAGFSRADQRALAEGADLGQVVNARRGVYTAGGRRFTTEGTTRRGLAGRRLGARRGSPAVRLTPDQIFADAASRDDAVRLLYRHGYLIEAPVGLDDLVSPAPIVRIGGSDIRAALSTRSSTVAQLRSRVTARGITVPTGLRKPALTRLVDDLDAGVPPAVARERAVRAILEERQTVADQLAEAAQMLSAQPSARAMAFQAGAIRRAVPAEVLPTVRPLLDALDAGDLARARAAIPTVVRGAKLRQVGEAGQVSRLDAARMDIQAAGDADTVLVVRPGFETTFERSTTLLRRAEVLPAPGRAPAAKVAKKAAPRKAAIPDLTGSRGLSSDPAVRAVQVENRIRQAYRDAVEAGARGLMNIPVRRLGQSVRLSEVRSRLGELDRAEVDAALRRMAPDAPETLGLEDAQWTLTAADREAGIRFGGENVTMLRLNDPSLRPLPAAPAKKATPAATYDDRLAELRRIADSRVTRVETPEQGLFGEVEVQVRDGRRVVRKVNTEEDAVRNTDAEELAARVMAAIGARSPAVLRLDETSMLQEFIDGVSARTLVDDVARRRAFAESDDGRLIGLGDILTANSDQGLSNLIITADGRIVAVDYGAAFTRGFRLTFNDADEFSRPLLGKTNDLSPADMAIIRPRLEALRPEFERLGHLDWHRQMMARFERLERAATGTRPRLAVPAKKATPRKATPKAPPAPAKMTAPALRRELQPIVDAAPDGLRLDLAGVPKPTLEAWTAKARELRPDQLAEEVGRWRQVVVDRRRALADALVEADELLANGASAATMGARARARLRTLEARIKGWPDEAPLRALVTAMSTGNPAAIRRAITAAQRKVGLKQLGDNAGAIGRFDPKTMMVLGGGRIPDGAPVTVVRPGYTVEIGGREVVLSRPVVEEATGVHTLPRKAAPTPAKAGAEAKVINPGYGSTSQGPTYPDAPVVSTSPRTGKVVSRRYTEDMGPLPSGAFEENCTNVVLAWDMRMRGYDVRAAPMDVLDRAGYAAGRTFDELDDLVARAYRLPNGRPHGRSFASQQWRSFDEIEREILRDWPEGGRGFITVGKHVFNVVKRNGKMEFVEAQFDANASRIVTALYRRKYKSARFGGEVQEGKLIRLDDLEPADGILDAVRPA